MFDPGAMGTLLIGLKAAQNEAEAGRVRGSVAPPGRGRSVRAAIASALRRVADQLQPPTVGEPAT